MHCIWVLQSVILQSEVLVERLDGIQSKEDGCQRYDDGVIEDIPGAVSFSIKTL